MKRLLFTIARRGQYTSLGQIGWCIGVIALQLAIAPVAAADTTTQVQYLSGRDGFNTVDWNFSLSSGRGSGVQTTIRVPSQIELQGFGAYSYNANYANTGTAQYSYNFNVSPDWAGKRIYIVFEGAGRDTTVFINGQQVGPTHQGSFYRFTYDITSFVNVGASNSLGVTILPNDPVLTGEWGDYWSYWGISRPVYLEAFPSQFVERVAINARADGFFGMDTYLNGVSTATSVVAQIRNLDGTPVGAPFSAPVASGDTLKTLTTTIQNPALWNSETPNLYQVDVTLMNGATPVHTATQKFGFRTIEIRPNDGLYVNGTKIRMRGFDRHVFWPTTGRSVSQDVEAVDLEAFKYMNANSVRSSHYPPDQSWLDLADAQGVYVMDELAGWQKATLSTSVGTLIVKEMVTRDVNHPSIIFWDNGNEGGWNTALDGQFDLWDPQNRRVLHPQQNFNGIGSAHYPTYATANTTTTSLSLYDEFDHCIGDGGCGASLNDFWNAMVRRPGTIGGMLWALVDEQVLRTDLTPPILDGGVTTSSSNDDGITGPYREREGSVNTVREIWSPIYIEMNDYKTYPAGFNGTLVVSNRYDFTNTNQVTFTWQLVNMNPLASLQPGHVVMKTGTPPSPGIPPRATGSLDLQLPADWATYDALYVTATDPNGKDLYTWTFNNKKAADYAAGTVTKTGSVAASGLVDANVITVSANGTVVQFSTTTGQISSVSANGKPISLAGGALTALDNAATPVERATAVLQSIAGSQSGNNYVVDVAFNASSTLKSMKWTMLPSGWLQLDYQYSPPTTTTNYKLYGMRFQYPEANIRSMRFLAHGPNRVWKNRMKGTGYDVFAKAYNTTERGLLKVNDLKGYTTNPSEFRGYYSNMLWADVSTSEGAIWMVSGNDDTFLQMAPKPSNFQTAGTLVDPGFANGTFSFLDAIPPIADKFQSPPNLGPESNWNIPAGATFTKTMYFKFDPDEAPGVIPAPFVFAGPDATAVQGLPFASAGSFTDEGATGSWSGTVDYGDGSGLQPLPLTGKTFGLHHAYRNVGVYNLEARVTDYAGHTSTDTAFVTVGYLPSGVFGDVNGDGLISCPDLTISRSVVGKRAGQPGFLPTADIDNNGVIDIRDIAAISRLLPAGTRCN
jgi:hypothetical protein